MLKYGSCDTICGIGIGLSINDKHSQRTKCTIFGKNSDRKNDEIQIITFYQSKEYQEEEDKECSCTYMNIPQVSKTCSIILSQPIWMYGGEMGINEYGVCIGNEAVWTRERYREKGLLGMDLVRLGLERGSTAKECMDIIIDLLEKYGQGGNGGMNFRFMYHNSFLIVDYKEGYVLETADKWWCYERVKEGEVRSISNELSIKGKGHGFRKGLIKHAIDKGYCKNEQEFDWAKTMTPSISFTQLSSFFNSSKPTLIKCFTKCQWSDLFYDLKNLVADRHKTTMNFLEKNKEKLNLELISQLLKDDKGSVCMHGSLMSTGSQISVLSKDFNLSFFTSTSSPCKSVYHPFTFSSDCVGLSNCSDNHKDGLWLRHKKKKKKMNEKDIQRLKIIEKNNFEQAWKMRYHPEKIVKLNAESISSINKLIL